MTDWSHFAAYQCRRRRCQEDCINRADSPYAQTKLCRACYQEADPDDLDDLNPLSHHLPGWARGLDIDHSTDSPEEPHPRTGECQDPTHPPTDRPTHRQGGSACSADAPSEDHRERPPAMGVRPRTAAHTPNPEGEGVSSDEAHQPDSADSNTHGSD